MEAPSDDTTPSTPRRSRLLSSEREPLRANSLCINDAKDQLTGTTRMDLSDEFINDRLVPTRKFDSLVPYSIQDANSASMKIREYTLENEDLNPGYALMLQHTMLDMSTGPISSDKHAQLEQLKRLKPRKLFRYKSNGPAEKGDGNNPFFGDFTYDSIHRIPRKSPWKIAKSPYKIVDLQVLDAPSLQDDFYLNLVDWSVRNILAVGLGSCVYLWNASTSKVDKLCDVGPHDSVCSVCFSQLGSCLSIGTDRGDVQIWEMESFKKIHSLTGHKSVPALYTKNVTAVCSRVRVGAMAWSASNLSTGGRDRMIFYHDIRTEKQVHKLAGHASEICGLKWSLDDRQLASGGNDNRLSIWELRSPSAPVMSFLEHRAAVKAIAWSPHQYGLLASGGGTADRNIRFWSTCTGECLSAVDTGSQVCNLSWSKNTNQLASSHGYSQNQIVIWNYPEMTKLSTLTGHTCRVLYLAASPDGRTIVTGAGDETLRFWNVFPPIPGRNEGGNKSICSDFR